MQFLIVIFIYWNINPVDTYYILLNTKKSFFF